MSDRSLIERYNYAEFVPGKFETFMKFEESPPLGKPVPDFPLWELDGRETRLGAVWSAHTYTIVEFGSFT